MAETARQPLHTGGCQCGAVRFALFAAPERVHLCHCRMCQKAVGGPFAALAPVKRRDFAWTRGAPATFASSTIARRDFCSRCGTPLSFHYVDGDGIALTIGSFDRPEAVPPTRLYGVESRLSWIDGVAALPAETTEASMSAARRAAIVDHQHPDRETPPDWAPPR
ncbi:MAG: GFA family protein [Alphaproteobacteria bacterium]|nr:GFA family protein [Alphaproteobacteria bacterium]